MRFYPNISLDWLVVSNLFEFQPATNFKYDDSEHVSPGQFSCFLGINISLFRRIQLTSLLRAGFAPCGHAVVWLTGNGGAMAPMDTMEPPPYDFKQLLGQRVRERESSDSMWDPMCTLLYLYMYIYIVCMYIYVSHTHTQIYSRVRNDPSIESLKW